MKVAKHDFWKIAFLKPFYHGKIKPLVAKHVKSMLKIRVPGEADKFSTCCFCACYSYYHVSPCIKVPACIRLCGIEALFPHMLYQCLLSRTRKDSGQGLKQRTVLSDFLYPTTEMTFIKERYALSGISKGRHFLFLFLFFRGVL